MLIKFSVENYKSFKELMTFDLTKTAGDEKSGNYNSFGKGAYLHSAIIYGSNASGKSNLLEAMFCMFNLILSHMSSPMLKLDYHPFSFDLNSKNSSTMFEITVLIEGDIWQYGFNYNADRIMDEWLYLQKSNSSRTQIIFTREFHTESQTYDYKFGPSLKGEKKLWSKSTKDNSLFITTAVSLNCDFLNIFSEYIFRNFLYGSEKGFVSGGIRSAEDKDEICIEPTDVYIYNNRERTDKLIRAMKQADFHICNIEVKKRELKDINIHFDDSIPEEIKNSILKSHSYDTVFYHEGKDGNVYPLSLKSESEGTRQYFMIIGMVIQIMESGGVIIWDELNNSLHPLLLENIINLFHNPKINTKHAQLICTCHDLSVMRQDIFRRDQIWLMERDCGESKLTSLSDYKVRKDFENISNFYLLGRYGAIPSIDNTKFIEEA